MNYTNKYTNNYFNKRKTVYFVKQYFLKNIKIEEKCRLKKGT